MKFRLLAGAAGLMGLAMLAAARGLEPDARGFGTHEQLGLSPCLFHRWTERQCPACGTTTAWAHVLRGQFRAAAAANLGGTILCGLVLIGAPWLLTSAAAGHWLLLRPSLPLALVGGTVWLTIAMLDWLRRLYFS